MPLAMFDTTTVVAFAREITSDLYRSFPKDTRVFDAKSLAKRRKLLDAIVGKCDLFAKNHHPNLYKKAKFLNTIKWELKEAGYEAIFIEETVRLLANVMR